MRRTILTMATTMALMVLLVGGVALALNPVNCVSGASRCVGTSLDDLINGSPANDVIFARHGDDTVNGNGGGDEIHGGGGNDTLNGNADDDTLFGEGRADTLDGGAGADNYGGGSGNDTIDAADANDPNNRFEVAVGNRGDDHINTVDGHEDHIACGAGTDVVDRDANIDLIPTPSECETINTH